MFATTKRNRFESYRRSPAQKRRSRLQVEQLESRFAPALSIRLDLVALHEFGHSLGLAHSSDPASIMYPYYNANYNLANFAGDSAVATFQSIYSGLDSGPWKNSLDGAAGDGTLQITYSFMPDGTRLDTGTKNTLFATMNADFGATATWQQIFIDALNRWAGVSPVPMTFVSHSDNGEAFNTAGSPQADPNVGDIRIGAHRFDGPGKTLAHTYYPPPNGATAAGDSHYDQAENWVPASSPSSQPTGNGGGGGSGNMTLGFVIDQTPLVEEAIRRGAGNFGVARLDPTFVTVRYESRIVDRGVQAPAPTRTTTISAIAPFVADDENDDNDLTIETSNANPTNVGGAERPARETSELIEAKGFVLAMDAENAPDALMDDAIPAGSLSTSAELPSEGAVSHSVAALAAVLLLSRGKPDQRRESSKKKLAAF